jgi:hypothetical protein
VSLRGLLDLLLAVGQRRIDIRPSAEQIDTETPTGRGHQVNQAKFFNGRIRPRSRSHAEQTRRQAV